MGYGSFGVASLCFLFFYELCVQSYVCTRLMVSDNRNQVQPLGIFYSTQGPISYFSHHSDHVPDRSCLREKGLLRLTVRGDTVNHGEGAGHIVSMVLRQQREMNACTQITVSFSFSLGPQLWSGAAHIQDRFPHLN